MILHRLAKNNHVTFNTKKTIKYDEAVNRKNVQCKCYTSIMGK